MGDEVAKVRLGKGRSISACTTDRR